jgi:molybdate transport system substrate-binding protein
MRCALVALYALAVAWLPQGSGQRPVITVSAAISLTDVLEEIGRAYTASGGGEVRFNFAASNVLARQIVSGAPVDVFISADEAQMDVADSAGAIVHATRFDLLGNRLVVLASPAIAGSSADLSVLAQPHVKRIAIGDPEAVPAGVYARRYLQAAGLWDKISGKIVPVSNVRAALAAVENGSADIAIVYESDGGMTRRSSVAAVLSGPGAPRIVYPAAICAASKQRRQAEHFLTFLRGRQASAVFKRYHFLPLAERREPEGARLHVPHRA